MQTFTRGALTFDVLDEGPGDGEVVLLLHGFPQSGRSWELVAPRLHDAGYRTLAPDQRGYSPGARPTGRRAYAVDELVADAVAAIDAAGADRAHVVGHDWGAVVGWALAARHPDRVATLTALSVPHAGSILRSTVRSTQLLHSWYMLAFQLPRVPEWAMGPGTPRGAAALRRTLVGSGMPAGEADRMLTLLAEPGAFTAAVNWYRGLPFAPPRASAAPVTVPTTYVWADRDEYVTRAAATGCGRFVEAPYRFEILRGSDHWMLQNAVDTIAPLIIDQLRHP